MMNVLIVDDHPLIQEAVAHVLRQIDPQATVEFAGNCQGGLAIAAIQSFDLVLLDLELPDASGISALGKWRSRFPDLPVVILSAANDHETMVSAMHAGAAGFIPKSSSNAVMANAVRLVHAGGKYIPPALLAAPSQARPAALRGSHSLADLGLTARQVDVLRLIGLGASNKVICRELGLAERTVKAHVTAVLRALRVASRTQAAVAATKRGLIK